MSANLAELKSRTGRVRSHVSNALNSVAAVLNTAVHPPSPRTEYARPQSEPTEPRFLTTASHITSRALSETDPSDRLRAWRSFEAGDWGSVPESLRGRNEKMIKGGPGKLVGVYDTSSTPSLVLVGMVGSPNGQHTRKGPVLTVLRDELTKPNLQGYCEGLSRLLEPS